MWTQWTRKQRGRTYNRRIWTSIHTWRNNFVCGGGELYRILGCRRKHHLQVPTYSVDPSYDTWVASLKSIFARHGPLFDCVNGIQDVDESDVDCGGPCMACSDGEICNTDRDCYANLECARHICVALAPTIDNEREVYLDETLKSAANNFAGYGKEDPFGARYLTKPNEPLETLDTFDTLDFRVGLVAIPGQELEWINSIGTVRMDKDVNMLNIINGLLTTTERTELTKTTLKDMIPRDFFDKLKGEGGGLDPQKNMHDSNIYGRCSDRSWNEHTRLELSQRINRTVVAKK